MEPPPSLAKYIPQNSKFLSLSHKVLYIFTFFNTSSLSLSSLSHYPNRKRVFSGGCSSSFMDPEVIEIPPPNFPISKTPKQNQVILHEVIDVDKYEDSADVMVLDEKVDARNKGKAVESNCSGNDQYKEALASHHFCPAGVETIGSVNGVEPSKSSAAELHNIINLESDWCYDEYFDLFSNDFMDVDEYANLQACFDKVDIPAGVEAPIPWLLDCAQNKKKTANGNDSFYTCQTQSDGVNLVNMMPASASSSTLQTSMDILSHPAGENLSSPWLHPQAGQSKNSVAWQHRGKVPNFPIWAESSKSRRRLRSSRSKSKQVAPSSATNYSSVQRLDAMTLPLGVEPPFWKYFPSAKQVGTSNAFYSSFPPQMDPLHHPPVVEPSVPLWQGPSIPKQKPAFLNLMIHSNFYNPFDPVHIPPHEGADIPQVQDSARIQINVDEEDILRRFELFKQFDTVEDYSDHHYASSGSSMKQPSKNWAKRIQEEWRILEKDLPDTIFVRVYETRMDLLRAVIVGAEGTPYHDGLFFFDVFFPGGYPNVPPHVFYHSGGLRLNPNLYSCGKVCLSLLNTWSGNKNEKWLPGVSTMLQVLVSIQALILNQKPFFNEPGYERMSGSANGELRSQQYNEDTFILSLRTMLYTMRRPLKNFKDFVVGHFFNRGHDILVACKAYMDGAQVGCLVKGGVQDLDEGDKSCSKKFQESVSLFIDMLVQEFRQVGARDCEKFLTQAKQGNHLVVNLPKAAI